jgi:molybdopterin-guanine dinucleotide biosynthesis protein A
LPTRTILGRVIARLSPQCAGLIIGNGDPALCATGPVVADDVAVFRKTLAGILAALD